VNKALVDSKLLRLELGGDLARNAAFLDELRRELIGSLFRLLLKQFGSLATTCVGWNFPEGQQRVLGIMKADSGWARDVKWVMDLNSERRTSVPLFFAAIGDADVDESTRR
jgi:hypothetical protein